MNYFISIILVSKSSAFLSELIAIPKRIPIQRLCQHKPHKVHKMAQLAPTFPSRNWKPRQKSKIVFDFFPIRRANPLNIEMRSIKLLIKHPVTMVLTKLHFFVVLQSDLLEFIKPDQNFENNGNKLIPLFPVNYRWKEAVW